MNKSNSPTIGWLQTKVRQLRKQNCRLRSRVKTLRDDVVRLHGEMHVLRLNSTNAGPLALAGKYPQGPNT